MKSAGHVEGGGGIGDCGDFAVVGLVVVALRNFGAEVDGGGVAAFLEIEVGSFGGGTVEHQRLDRPD